MALTLVGCAPEPVEIVPSETAGAAEDFNSSAAWDEFESTFRLFYAYLERDTFDVEALLRRTEVSAKSTGDAAAFRSAVRRMSYAFTDPHLIVGPLTDENYNVFPTSADLIIGHRSGDYFVQDVRAESPAYAAGVRPEWQVVSVEGQTPEAVVDAFFDGLIDDPTSKQRAYAVTIAANGRRQGGREIAFSTGEMVKTVILSSPRDFAIGLSEDPILDIRMKGETGIIRINNALGDNDLIAAFDAAMSEIRGAKYLILDLRNTPSGGNTEVGRSIIGHFIDKIAPYQVHEIPSLEREYTVPRHFVEYAKPRPPYFDPANAVVLAGKWTGSMGEGIVIGLDAAADMTVIASDMGDLLGGLSNRNLPLSGMRLDLGTETLFHVGGTPREDYTADIDLPYADTNPNGKDPAMMAAAAYFKTRDGK